MIKFEINTFPFALTNDQFDKINDIIRCAPELDYDVVEGDTDGIVWLWAHHEVEPECENPTRYWIGMDGTVSLAEEVDWDWKGVGAPTPHPERFDLTALYPIREGENAGAWSDRVLTHAREHGTNRQCSLGWHTECSNPSGTECMCLCHGDGAEYWSVEGHTEGDLFLITRAEPGKQHWPAQPGEPENMWAHWLLATSKTDAETRAIKKMEARRG